MPSYQIAIPSYGRPTEIHKKTLAFLRANNIPIPLITIFVASEEERLEYELHNSEYNIVVGAKGLKEQRNFIFNYYPQDARVVSLDDDIEDLYRLNDEGRLVPTALVEVIERGFQLCETHKRNLWGIYPIKNAYFMSRRATTDFRFLIGHLFGFINKKITLTQPLKEDYEMSALYSKQDGGVIRMNDICAKTKMYNKNGIGSKASRRETNKECCQYLIGKYPQYFAINKRKEGELRCLIVRSPR